MPPTTRTTRAAATRRRRADTPPPPTPADALFTLVLEHANVVGRLAELVSRELGDALRAARNDKGLSLADVSGAASIAESDLSALERGKKVQPTPDTYERVRAAIAKLPARADSPAEVRRRSE